MGKAWLWGTFGALLVGGILAGFVPDLKHAATLRTAREAGFVLPPHARLAKDDDAFSDYGQAIFRHPDAPGRLLSQFEAQTKHPAPDVVAYLDEIVEASTKPGCSFLPDGVAYGPAFTTSYQAGTLHLAARAIAARARNEAGLLPAARVAGHLRQQNGVSALAYGADLIEDVADRAGALGLDAPARSRLRIALGPPIAPRDALRQHVGWTVGQIERRMPQGWRRLPEIYREADYGGYWVRWFRKAPADDALLARYLGDTSGEIDMAERPVGYRTDFSWVPGTTPRWQAWAERLERANARLRSFR